MTVDRRRCGKVTETGHRNSFVGRERIRPNCLQGKLLRCGPPMTREGLPMQPLRQGRLSGKRVGMSGTGTTVASEMSGLCIFCPGLPGDASTSFRWLRDGLWAVRRGARKGRQKCCIFPKSDALLEIGVLTREKKGEKRYENSASIGMHHFCAKIGENGGAAGAGFRVDSGWKFGAEMGLLVVGGLPKVYRFCLCFVEVYRIEQEGTLQVWLPADVYETRASFGDGASRNHCSDDARKGGFSPRNRSAPFGEKRY